MDSFVRDLRNVEWELYLLYRNGPRDLAREDLLWGEVERLLVLVGGVS